MAGLSTQPQRKPAAPRQIDKRTFRTAVISGPLPPCISFDSPRSITRIVVSTYWLPRRIIQNMRMLLQIIAVATALLTSGLGVPAEAQGETASETAIRAALTSTAGAETETSDERRWRADLLEVYKSRSFAPLWLDGGRPTAQALAALSELRRAQERGLRSSDYDLGELVHEVPLTDAGGRATPASMARLDVSLSLSLARFVSDLHMGRVVPEKAGYNLDASRPGFSAIANLLPLTTSESVTATLDRLEPQFLHYRLLKNSLARYRQLAARPGLVSLPNPGKSAVKPGELYAGAPALRQLLAVMGDIKSAAPPPDAEEMRLDAGTVQALKAFQARHGLAQDGALGRDTFRALATPFADRVRQIELSLERWRWLPPKLPAPSIFVNIPQFRLFALYTSEDVEQQMLRMDVIVGKSFPLMQTPVFAADMRYIVLHPYWDVPYSIVKRELMPSIEADPGYIARNGYEIVRGQTDAAAVEPVTEKTKQELADGTLRLRQRPGPKNPLGFVKFMLPNRYNVYLHGTSAPALFAGARRAFSHGCIRVADPMALLSYVLRGDPEWNQERVAQQLIDPGPRRINLREPIRVFILYTTALATEDGRTLFFSDIYGQDPRLEALLDERSRRLTP
jgi:L,D-transpeptidase YcbB